MFYILYCFIDVLLFFLAMSDSAFDLIEKTARSGGSGAAFDFLIQRLREEKNYPLLFEARLMKKRLELGLSLIPIDSLEDLPEETQRAYQTTYIEAAREVGGLFLAEGDIARAWPYFRAIGETEPVTAAIEAVASQEEIEPVIEIAFHERVHPRKGFELILTHQGICRAITSFGQYPVGEGRRDSLRLLVRQLHGDLVESLKRVIAGREGERPDAQSIQTLMKGRDWLFERDSYHVDASHLAAVVQYSVELSDPETLRLALELTEYGKRLSPMFQSRGHPPFDDFYADYGVYLRALLGEDVDGAAAHFRSKVARLDPEEMGSAPAQSLVQLLARLKRYDEAVEVSMDYLQKVAPSELSCPSVNQLCRLAGDPRKLKEIARQQEDLLSFTAGVVDELRS